MQLITKLWRERLSVCELAPNVTYRVCLISGSASLLLKFIFLTEQVVVYLASTCEKCQCTFQLAYLNKVVRQQQHNSISAYVFLCVNCVREDEEERSGRRIGVCALRTQFKTSFCCKTWNDLSFLSHCLLYFCIWPVSCWFWLFFCC